MKSNLAYLDDRTDRAVRVRSERAGDLSDAKRKEARKAAMKSVAGFDVFDEAAERAALDAMIAKNRETVEAFVTDRTAVLDKLTKAGVTALAMVPLESWKRICRSAGLFMLTPNSQGRVRIASSAFDGFAAGGKILSDEAVNFAGRDWKGWLGKLFPQNTDAANNGAEASLVLPVPPQDVVDVLLKLNRAGVPMKTAAVPEAISFKESVAELRKHEMARREEEARRLEALRHDPIIYTEHGSVAAIVAQFGDFPIEQEVIDAVVKADDFIPEKPKAADLSYFGNGLEGQYQAAMRMMAMQQLQQGSLLQTRNFLGNLITG